MLIHIDEKSNSIEQDNNTKKIMVLNVILFFVFVLIYLFDKLLVLKKVSKYKLEGIIVEKMLEYEVGKRYGFNISNSDTIPDSNSSSDDGRIKYHNGEYG